MKRKVLFSALLLAVFSLASCTIVSIEKSSNKESASTISSSKSSDKDTDNSSIEPSNNSQSESKVVSSSSSPKSSSSIINSSLEPTLDKLEFTLVEEKNCYSVKKSSSISGKLVIPDTYNFLPVKYIEEKAFVHCGITNVFIPKTIVSIGEMAFYGCVSVKEYVVDPNNTFFKSSDGVLFSKDGTTLVYYPGGRKEACTIPEGVTSIGSNSFWSASITSLTIPNTVEKIGESAFFYCVYMQGDLIIPDSVTEINSWAFEGCSKITSLTIGKGLTKLKAGTFAHCRGLTSVVVPDNITYMDSANFQGCSKLESVTLSKNLTSIGQLCFFECPLKTIALPDPLTTIPYWAFYNCVNLESISIGKNVHEISDAAFSGCVSLESITIDPENPYIFASDGVIYYQDAYEGTYIYRASPGVKNVTIPNTITSIKENSFTSRKSLTSINIPDSVTEIESYAFSNCESLESLIIPSSVTKIGDSAFDGCKSLESLIIPSSVTEIGARAFGGCSSLVSINIMCDITAIEDGLFSGCSSLESVNIPNSVTRIKGAAFRNCASLTSITIPENVEFIGSTSFYGCSALENIYVDENNQHFKSDDGILFNQDKTALLCYPAGKTGAYVIADDVTEIGLLAFALCANLGDIKIGAGLNNIANSAFQGCTSLETIVIPDNIEKISNSAFEGCSSLKTIVLGSGLRRIESDSFRDCSSIESIFYHGTSDEYYRIENTDSIPNIYNMTDKATIYFYRENEPTTTGDYWHYVDGKIVIWGD